MKNYVYTLGTLLLLLLTSSLATATHLRGGYIHYTLDPDNHRKVHFTMTLYTASESPADEPWVTISLGDGVTVNVERHSATQLRPNVKRSIYKWEYTYPAHGTFFAGWIGENRNRGILNLAAPSDQISMVIATHLSIHPLNLNRHGVQIKSEPYFTAYQGEPLKFNLLAYDLDGDSLAYELIAPQYRNEQGVIGPAPGYTVPDDFSINRYGEVYWENPDKLGEYVHAVLITQFRNGQQVGQTVYDMQFLVMRNPSGPEQAGIENKDDLTFTKDGLLLVKPGEKLNLKLRFPARTEKSLLSELQHRQVADLAFSSSPSGAGGDLADFSFTATEELARNQPYAVDFYYTATVNGSTVRKVLTVPILIWQPQDVELQLLQAHKLPHTPEGYISSTPGKASKLLVFAKNGLGNITELTMESSLSKDAEQFSFVTRDSADSVVGELIFKPAEKQISSTPYNITVRSSSMQLRTSDSSPVTKEVTYHVLVAAASPLSSGEDLASDKAKVYPNPAKRSITIRAQRPTDVFSLYAADGRLVYQAKVVIGENHLNLPADLKPGLYTYSISNQVASDTKGRLLLL